MTRAQPRPQTRLLVLYDADCAACIWLVAVLLRLDRRRALAPATIQSEREGVLRHVRHDLVLRSWHVQTMDGGQVVSAGAALVQVLRALPLTALPAVLLSPFPRLAERLYVAVSSRRATLARLLPQGWKDQARLTVAQRELEGTRPGPGAVDVVPVGNVAVGGVPPVTGATAVLPPTAEPVPLPDAAAPPPTAPVTPVVPPAPVTSTGATGTSDTSVRGAFRLVAVHLRPLRLKMAVGLVLMVLAAVTGLGQPLATRYVLDSIASRASLLDAVLVLVALVPGAALAQGGGQYLVLRATEDVVLSSRRRLVDRVLDLSLVGMRRQKPGDLMARITSDTALLRQIAMQSLVQLVTGAVVVVGATVVMVLLDAVLFVITAAVVAVLGLLLGLIMPRIRRSAKETQRNVGEMGSELERVLGAYVTVKAAGAEDLESARVADRLVRAHDSGVRTALWNSLAAMTSGLAVQAAFLVVLGVGGWRVQTGDLSVATLIAFLLYAMQLSSPVVQLTQAVSAFQAGRAALERIGDVDRMEREASPEDDASSPLVPGSLAALGAVSWERAAQLERVTLRYPGQAAPAVCEVDLTVPQRGVTAIVGPSGSGKSSILKLLEGFYPLESGTVRVGGRPLAEWDLAQLRRDVAYVEQETPVFAGSLEDNLTYGLGDVREDELMTVVEQAGLGERVPTADDVQMQVGHRGSALSGGERQRVAVARALLRSPRLLLLDEATSQLDAASEAAMRDLIAETAREIAVVLVAHRLSTAVSADQIVVMQDGRVRAVGRHHELLARDALYRGLVEEQESLGLAPRAGARP